MQTLGVKLRVEERRVQPRVAQKQLIGQWRRAANGAGVGRRADFDLAAGIRAPVR